MKISKPDLKVIGSELIYSVNVHSNGKSQNLWYAVEEKYGSLVSDRSDASLLALLIPAMMHREDIYIEGDISEKLYYNLIGRYQKILKIMMPSLSIINIFPGNILSETISASGVATGFSAGIDSFNVLVDHHYSPISSGYKVSHLLFNNVGSHDIGGREHGNSDSNYNIFVSRYKSLKKIVDNIGIPFVYVNSNLSSFYGGYGFHRSHTPRNASVALLLQKGIGKYLYASGLRYQDIFIGEINDTAYSDPITLPLMSTEVLEAIAVGSEYSRVEKTLMVATIEESYNSLDVCVKPNASLVGNCSVCGKCLRTLLTLEIAGLIEKYRNVFNLEEYRSGTAREIFIAKMFHSNHPLHKEIIEFAKERNFSFPLYSHILGRTGLIKLLEKFNAMSAKAKV